MPKVYPSIILDTLNFGLNPTCIVSQGYTYAQNVTSLHSIPAELPKSRAKRPPRRFYCGVVMETTGSRETSVPEEHLKVFIFFPILDAMLSEVEQRFGKNNLEHMRAIQACSPSSATFLEPNTILSLAESYGIELETLSIECTVAKHTLIGKNMDSIADAYSELSSFKIAFPLLIKVLQIVLTTVVTTAHCERSLKRIKSYLRSTMTEQSIEQELANKSPSMK